VSGSLLDEEGGGRGGKETLDHASADGRVCINRGKKKKKKEGISAAYAVSVGKKKKIARYGRGLAAGGKKREIPVCLSSEREGKASLSQKADARLRWGKGGEGGGGGDMIPRPDTVKSIQGHCSLRLGRRKKSAPSRPQKNKKKKTEHPNGPDSLEKKKKGGIAMGWVDQMSREEEG